MLASAGLFTHSLHNLRTLDPGFQAGGLDSFSINPRLLGYVPERSQRLTREFYRELRAMPGVTAVAYAKYPLLTNSIDLRGFSVEGVPLPDGTSNALADNSVSPGFFSAMGIPLLAGRELRETDTSSAPMVAVINESLSRKFFEGRNPVGLHVTSRRTGAPYEIVGVVKDAKYDDLREHPKPFIYLAASQDADPGPVTFYLRSRIGASPLGVSVRGVARRLDPALPVAGPQTVEQQILTSVFVDRMVAALASTFAILATLLAAIGLYGVVAWAVTRRRRELGIRMALGAQPGAVMRMVLGEVLWLGAIGVAVAVPLWIVAGRILKTLLYGVSEHDPATLALALAVLITVAGSAGFVPAWRASRIDPTTAIRDE
jgi:predicted permease